MPAAAAPVAAVDYSKATKNVYIPVFDPMGQSGLGWTLQGTVLVAIAPNGRGGAPVLLRPGDTIVRVDGKAVETATALYAAVGQGNVMLDVIPPSMTNLTTL